MPHHTPLIATIVAGLTIAFAFGAIAHRLKISPLVGYLLAGVVVGPFTPGYVADQALANELAEIGVILLMFGVGLHFSLKDLLSVKAIAIPGAVAQMATATLLGMGLAHLMGWSLMAGIVFGLALSVASTVVLLRALQERRIVQTDRGRIAVGWLIVEDLAMVLALVMIPALAGVLNPAPGTEGGDWMIPLGITIAKVAGFVAFMLIVGRRVVPWVLHYIAHTGSRELFRLAVLAIALGIAFGAATLFGVSFALGAFFAGMILAESELSHRAAEETLPLRDAFAVLFFVSVGMLFNPAVLTEQALPLVATVAIIVIGKSIVAYAIVRMFKHDNEHALTIAASLAQIGEFSFILAGLGVELNLLPEEGRDLILGGAIISILLNPLIFGLAARFLRRKADPVAAAGVAPPANDIFPTGLTEHTILVGYGLVGKLVAKGLEVAGQPFLIIENRHDRVVAAGEAGYEVFEGNAHDGRLLSAARTAEARRLFVAVPDGFEGGQIVEQARRANPGIQIIARAHSDEEVRHLVGHGADEAIMAEQEIAAAMLERALSRARAVRDADSEEEAAPPDLILDDGQSAVMKAVISLGLGPGEAISRQALALEADRFGPFAEGRLADAIERLHAKRCLQVLDEDRVSVTRLGFMVASRFA